MTHALPPDDAWVLLTRAGLQQPHLGQRLAGAFDALADPVATDALASALAERLRPLGLDLVVVWEGLNSAILGYAVGLRLGLTVAVLSDDEGLVSTATPSRPSTRAAFVAALPPDASIARMANSFLASHGSTLVAIATLVAQPGQQSDQEESTITLVTLPPEEPDSGSLPRRGDNLHTGGEPPSDSRHERR